jgi:glutathione S-transferase
MLRIYHAPLMRSIRIIWLAEELGLPYEIERLTPEQRRGPAFRALHPQGKIPVIEDGPFTMFESCAIMQYLLDRYGEGRLQPEPGTSEAAAYQQWLWFAEASFARPLGDMAQHTIIRPEAERMPAVVEDGRARASQCLAAVEARLGGRTYLGGDAFTAADIAMGWTLMLARHFGVLTPATAPTTARYLDHIGARPAAAIAFAA